MSEARDTVDSLRAADQRNVLERQRRWNRVRVANLYDTLDKMGFGGQCLDLAIKPLLPSQHLAGRAITVRGSRMPLAEAERMDQEAILSGSSVRKMVCPGSVVVVDGGGEPWTGKFGEMTSWAFKQRGAAGIVIDGFIRDYLGLIAIPDYTVCARGTSPIESSGRWHINQIDTVIALPGTLSSQVRVAPGDWIIADADGTIVVPAEVEEEALLRTEELEAREQGMRRDLANGVSFEEAYQKWERA